MVCVQVCLAAVGLVCDLCRALMANILPHCDEMMQLLLENLGVSNSHFLKDTFYVCVCVFVCARMCNRTPSEITHLYIVIGIALLQYYVTHHIFWKRCTWSNALRGEKDCHTFYCPHKISLI